MTKHDHTDDELEHEHGPLAELVTVRDWLRYAVTRFNRGGIFCGHGVGDTYDEAVWLILGSLALPLDRLEPFLDACIPGEERIALFEAIEQRADARKPTAYILGEAWLGDFRFTVDERVIVPRSFFAELLEEGLSPWVEDPERVGSALDLCTGSGCLAVLMAHAFPHAEITAADLSEDALDVAQTERRRLWPGRAHRTGPQRRLLGAAGPSLRLDPEQPALRDGRGDGRPSPRIPARAAHGAGLR